MAYPVNVYPTRYAIEVMCFGSKYAALALPPPPPPHPD